MVLHAEIHCLYNSGLATGDFGGATMYSTLMPYHMCADAIVLFGIPKVVAGGSTNFKGNGLDLLPRHGVDAVDLDVEEVKEVLRDFIGHNPNTWKRDIGR